MIENTFMKAALEIASQMNYNMRILLFIFLIFSHDKDPWSLKDLWQGPRLLHVLLVCEGRLKDLNVLVALPTDCGSNVSSVDWLPPFCPFKFKIQ